jgi:hypothetical protein
MGIERAVTRWYIQRQTYKNEVALLEAKLVDMQTNGQEPERQERAEVEEKLAQTEAKLYALGPCPKAMMG